MDQQELKDWVDFCEGRVSHDPDRFSQVFMEMFYPTLREQDKADLRKMFSYVPNSSKVLEFFLQMGTRAPDRSEEEIINLVLQDLKEMRRIITHPRVLAAMDLGVFEITHDRKRLRQSRPALPSPAGFLESTYIETIGDYFIEELGRRPGNEKIAALDEAFYGIACDLHLQSALTAELLGGEVNCGNYLELYHRGVDYSLEEKGVLVFIYRK